MKASTNPVETSERVERTHTFSTSAEAWAFMRQCDGKGVSAGYPSLTAPYTVRTLEPAVRS